MNVTVRQVIPGHCVASFVPLVNTETIANPSVDVRTVDLAARQPANASVLPDGRLVRYFCARLIIDTARAADKESFLGFAAVEANFILEAFGTGPFKIHIASLFSVESIYYK